MHHRPFNPVHLLSVASVLGAMLFNLEGTRMPAPTAQPVASALFRSPSSPRLRRRRGRLDSPRASGVPCETSWWDESWPPALDVSSESSCRA